MDWWREAADHTREKWGLAGWEAKDSKSLDVESCGGCKVKRNSQSHMRVHWKGGARAEQTSSIVPSLTSPPQTAATMQQRELPLSGRYLRLHPLTI